MWASNSWAWTSPLAGNKLAPSNSVLLVPQLVEVAVPGPFYNQCHAEYKQQFARSQSRVFDSAQAMNAKQIARSRNLLA
jgi:hypothetical protein